MIVKDLVGLIEEASYLSQADKEKWLNLLPEMDNSKLKELAAIILWAEKQKMILHKEKEIAIAGVAEIFTALNVYATQKAAKEIPKILENEIKEKEKAELDRLLKELENE